MDKNKNDRNNSDTNDNEQKNQTDKAVNRGNQPAKPIIEQLNKPITNPQA